MHTQQCNAQTCRHWTTYTHTKKIHVLRCKMGKVSTHNNPETTTFFTAPKKTRLLPGSFICSLEIWHMLPMTVQRNMTAALFFRGAAACYRQRSWTCRTTSDQRGKPVIFWPRKGCQGKPTAVAWVRSVERGWQANPWKSLDATSTNRTGVCSWGLGCVMSLPHREESPRTAFGTNLAMLSSHSWKLGFGSSKSQCIRQRQLQPRQRLQVLIQVLKTVVKRARLGEPIRTLQHLVDSALFWSAKRKNIKRRFQTANAFQNFMLSEGAKARKSSVWHKDTWTKKYWAKSQDNLTSRGDRYVARSGRWTRSGKG